MIGTISFGVGTKVERYGVTAIEARWFNKGDEAETVRIKLDRPYQVAIQSRSQPTA